GGRTATSGGTRAGGGTAASEDTAADKGMAAGEGMATGGGTATGEDGLPNSIMNIVSAGFYVWMRQFGRSCLYGGFGRTDLGWDVHLRRIGLAACHAEPRPPGAPAGTRGACTTCWPRS